MGPEDSKELVAYILASGDKFEITTPERLDVRLEGLMDEVGNRKTRVEADQVHPHEEIDDFRKTMDLWGKPKEHEVKDAHTEDPPEEPPHGVYSTRVDALGRLKLPAAFHHFLQNDGELTVSRSTSQEFQSCFISHSTYDQAFADRLAVDLKNKGVRCWFAPHDIRAGDKIHTQIDEAIREYERLLLILSEHSIASEWVNTEIAWARKKELVSHRRVLFPISLVPFTRLREWKCFDADIGKDSAREIREYFILDFSNWKEQNSYSAAFQRLLVDLTIKRPPGTASVDELL